jgi:uncharacterized membrane protein YphA (DoxX/SURF4 family)
MKYLVNICRVVVGVIFILSGLIKQNDPIGFSYKLEEYFEVFHITFMNPLGVTIAIVMSGLEIILGIALLIGFAKKYTLNGLLLLTIFFGFLTFYSAYFDVVKTCGCFGDALFLKPWTSFWKDMVLMSLVIIIIMGQRYVRSLFMFPVLVVVMAGTVVFSLGMGIFIIRHLPVVDFLPYRVGQNIPALLVIPSDAKPDIYEIIYTLKNKQTGENKEIDSKDYISTKIYADTNWKFVSATEPLLIEEGFKLPIADFIITNSEGNNLTDLLLENESYSFWIIEYDLNETDIKYQSYFNELTIMADKHKAEVIGITASSPSTAEEFRHQYNLFYDFMYCDAIPLKSIVRANPGVVLVKNGTIINKWNAMNMPTVSEVEKVYFSN